jgi:hypothetical protein
MLWLELDDSECSQNNTNDKTGQFNRLGSWHSLCKQYISLILKVFSFLGGASLGLATEVGRSQLETSGANIEGLAARHPNPANPTSHYSTQSTQTLPTNNTLTYISVLIGRTGILYSTRHARVPANSKREGREERD